MWYKEIWDAILEEEDNDNPFIEFAWFYNWWQIVGRKERVELYAISLVCKTQRISGWYFNGDIGRAQFDSITVAEALEALQ